MKKLEDIPKKNIFEVPDGYFNRLPGVIQSRIAEKNMAPVEITAFSLMLRYALPAIILVAATLFIYKNYFTHKTAEAQLALISTEALSDYLGENELSTDEFIETVGLENIDADALTTNPLMDFNLDENELEKLSEEYQTEL